MTEQDNNAGFLKKLGKAAAKKNGAFTWLAFALILAAVIISAVQHHS
jgi:hypothetical protein